MRRIINTSSVLKKDSDYGLHYMPEKNVLFASVKDNGIPVELNKQVSPSLLKYINFANISSAFNEDTLLDWSEDVSPIEFENNITLSSTQEIIDDKTLIYPYISTRIGAYKVYCTRVFDAPAMNKNNGTTYNVVINRNIVVFIDNNTVTTNTSKSRGRPVRNGFVFYTCMLVSGDVSAISEPTSVENLNASTNSFRTMFLYDAMSRHTLTDSYYVGTDYKGTWPTIDNTIDEVSASTTYSTTNTTSIRNGFIVYDSSDKSIEYTNSSFFPMINLNNGTQTSSFDDYYDNVTSSLASWGISDTYQIDLYVLLRSIGMTSDVITIADGTTSDTRDTDYWYLSEFLYSLFYSSFKANSNYYPTWAPTKYMGSPSSMSFVKYIDTSAGYMRIYDSEMNEFQWARYKLEGWDRIYTILAPRNTTHHGSVFSQEETAVSNWESKHSNGQTFYDVDFDAWRTWATALLQAKHSDDSSYSTDNLFSSVVSGKQTFSINNSGTTIISSISTFLLDDESIEVFINVKSNPNKFYAIYSTNLWTELQTSITIPKIDTDNYPGCTNRLFIIAQDENNEFDEILLTFIKPDADTDTTLVIRAWHYANNL